MLKLLKSLFGGVSGFFGGLLGFLGNTAHFIARTPMALLDLFGLIQPAPQQRAAEEAEQAAAEAQTQHFGSTLDKRAKVLTPDEKACALVDWCEWRTGVRSGPEPSLAGFSTREKIKLRAADEKTLQVLPLRTMPVIEQWLNSPRKTVEPLTQDQLKTVVRQMEQQDRESAEAIARWNAVADRFDAGRAANDIDVADADDLLKETEEVLSFRPRGFAAA